MPRGNESGASDDAGDAERRTPDPGWDPPPEVVRELAPWVDVRTVGPVGFYRWLRAVLPTLPTPSTGRAPPPDLDGRIAQLALALVDSACASAAAHFQASEYFRENLLLSRRVFALEAMLRTASVPLPGDPSGADRVAGRYLPRGSAR